MPQDATITAFYSFSPNTKARSSQVNANFSLFRGHLLPIDPNTASATDNTYDLGTDPWRWRTAYVNSIDYETSTNLASIVTKGDTAYTAGAFLVQIEGVERLRINGDGFAIPITQTYFDFTSVTFSVTTASTVITSSTLTTSNVKGPVTFDFISLTIGGSINGESQIAIIGTTTSDTNIALAIYRDGVRLHHWQLCGPASTSRVALGAENLRFTDYEHTSTAKYHLEFRASSLGFGLGASLRVQYMRWRATWT